MPEIFTTIPAFKASMNSLTLNHFKVHPVKNKRPLFFSLLILMLACSGPLFAQPPISSSDKKQLILKEDTLKSLSRNIVLDSNTAGRMISDSQFVKTLVRTLLIKNSFYYPLDSVIGIAKLYAPDTSFRIITWNISYNDYYHRQRGVIQFKPVNGVSKFIPLRDYSEFTTGASDSVRNHLN